MLINEGDDHIIKIKSIIKKKWYERNRFKGSKTLKYILYLFLFILLVAIFIFFYISRNIIPNKNPIKKNYLMKIKKQIPNIYQIFII